jgi:hypothetical protein
MFERARPYSAACAARLARSAARASSISTPIRWKCSRSETISDGVSRVEATEVAGFAVGEGVESVAIGCFPPGFELRKLVAQAAVAKRPSSGIPRSPHSGTSGSSPEMGSADNFCLPGSEDPLVTQSFQRNRAAVRSP